VEQEKLAIQARNAQKELEQLLRQVQYTQKEQWIRFKSRTMDWACDAVH